ncbi:TnsA endonuclease N-terminal domain-containing protein [Shewanella frigidimarina]|uniref:TnsA endonuclease N-terminal domain-containing protein n=1 Tax=Shewanella frigidimarina TaxID=56812 RepID=UPI003D7B47CF
MKQIKRKAELKTDLKTVKKLNAWKRDIAKGTYRSYLTVRDVNKVGRRHWMYCEKQHRQVHLLSDGERRMYTVMLYKANCVAIFEQYALDLDETLDIAVAMNLIHPRKWQNNEACVMTTDFLLESVSTKNKGKTELTAYTFKYWDQIYRTGIAGEIEQINKRTWQKFSIEREYWRRRGVEYRVVTERDATKEQQWNIMFCESSRDLLADHDELCVFIDVFLKIWYESPWLQVQELLVAVCNMLEMESKRAKDVFKYVVLYGLLIVSQKEYIRWFRPLVVAQFDGDTVK